MICAKQNVLLNKQLYGIGPWHGFKDLGDFSVKLMTVIGFPKMFVI